MRLRRWRERAGVEAGLTVRSAAPLMTGVTVRHGDRLLDHGPLRQFSLEVLDLGFQFRDPNPSDKQIGVRVSANLAQRLLVRGVALVRPLLDLGRLGLTPRSVSPHVLSVCLTHSYTAFLTQSYILTECA